MNRKGFLLLEAMLSILLISVGLVAVSMSFSVSKKILLRSREFFRSSLFLREKMFEIGQAGKIGVSLQSGSWKDESMAWSLRVEPLPETDLNRVELEVSEINKPDSACSLETYLNKPEK